MSDNLPATQKSNEIMKADPAALAAAESARAIIQAKFTMAANIPRNENKATEKILNACRRSGFAEKAKYAKPVGGGSKPIEGPSVRFAEEALRAWGNIDVQTHTVYDDERTRRIHVAIVDLETNTSYGKDIQIDKTVERKSDKGRTVVGRRINSYGEKVFIVAATEDELANKENALKSKVMRTEGLRLIPADITESAMLIVNETNRRKDSKDPGAAKKSICAAFLSINVKPKDIEDYLGHKLDTVTPKEIDTLRSMYSAINDNEATWQSYIDEKNKAAGKQPKKTSDKLSDMAKAKTYFCPNYDGAEKTINECNQCKDLEGCPEHS